MIRSLVPQTRMLIGATVALSMAAGLAAQPAQAQNGDIAKGILIGVATGVVVHEIAKDQRRRQVQQPIVVSQPHYERHYYERRERHHVRYVPAPRPTPISPTHRAFNSQDRQLRVSIQYELMQRGYYAGTLDGVWGPRTRQAVFDYARGHDDVARLTTVEGSNRVFSGILRRN
ncbi:peptidoglycan-binding domain-containing protein [Acidimangrovimonas pyrenivorans]|uniref:Peptidoglycan-binding protein n=1 Tax=Acidimangrovimonas pyrenivorans TaxID=2030798 RepID=A0ABV7AJG0_9RHOB